MNAVYDQLNMWHDCFGEFNPVVFVKSLSMNERQQENQSPDAANNG